MIAIQQALGNTRTFYQNPPAALFLIVAVTGAGVVDDVSRLHEVEGHDTTVSVVAPQNPKSV